ncbi:hypothetical protein T310_7540 [Rasamsonia emersonii CBS 393.64]|uniref:Uncharacterized protein n=1 Tax=Rasamsonia emersonii (strain ATCC 16479 / CBS 393.64 / IMI 116815) TaxID=1408163 RepID=A0A0F4YLL2_RASE3|nr:hypothetical protein T310_7540 [Rasamsonia emersonii CBS 393.64]KKA18503.1 hypothetical protein T310_7540 [Rasamsonia emersonii CBS 393.64]
MASKKDMRRADLVIPYVDPPRDKNEADVSGAMTSTLPMAAVSDHLATEGSRACLGADWMPDVHQEPHDRLVGRKRRVYLQVEDRMVVLTPLSIGFLLSLLSRTGLRRRQSRRGQQARLGICLCSCPQFELPSDGRGGYLHASLPPSTASSRNKQHNCSVAVPVTMRIDSSGMVIGGNK